MPVFPRFPCNASDWVGQVNQTGETMRWSSKMWKYGQLSDSMPGLPRMSSYEVVDEIIQYLQMEFLRLKRIDVVGYSTGADMGLIWSVLSSNGYRNMSNGGVRLRILLGSPNVYLYLNDRRPALPCTPLISTGTVAECRQYLEPGSSSLAVASCQGFNRFPFGPDGLERVEHGSDSMLTSSRHYLHEYMDEMLAKAELPAHFATKDVIFMVGNE